MSTYYRLNGIVLSGVVFVVFLGVALAILVGGAGLFLMVLQK